MCADLREMGRIRRGGYIFFTAIGDHTPRHVHIYRDGELIAKFDLEGWKLISGNMNRRLLQILKALYQEGKL